MAPDRAEGEPPQKTTIEITTDTRRDLRVWKASREMTYDEAIQELIAAYPEDDEHSDSQEGGNDA
jgi:hypothetical protein